MSALHGVVEPADWIEPYDLTLKTARRSDRKVWSQRVLQSLNARLGALSGIVFEIHAGADYRDFGLVEGLKTKGAIVEVPTQGLTQGQQLAFYKNAEGR